LAGLQPRAWEGSGIADSSTALDRIIGDFWVIVNSLGFFGPISRFKPNAVRGANAPHPSPILQKA
jgi:hypothetical protein